MDYYKDIQMHPVQPMPIIQPALPVPPVSPMQSMPSVMPAPPMSPVMSMLPIPPVMPVQQALPTQMMSLISPVQLSPPRQDISIEMQRQLQDRCMQDMMQISKELSIKAGEAEIAVRKKDCEAVINVNSQEHLCKKKADIAARRELMKTEIFISEGGEIRITRQMFGEELNAKVPFTIKECTVFKTQNRKESILRFMFSDGLKRTGEIYFVDGALDDRTINKKFNAAGIRFGHSHEKETMLRQELIVKLISKAEVQYVPLKKGWYIENGFYKFCFPEDITFEEVRRNV